MLAPFTYSQYGVTAGHWGTFSIAYEVAFVPGEPFWVKTASEKKRQAMFILASECHIHNVAFIGEAPVGYRLIVANREVHRAVLDLWHLSQLGPRGLNVAYGPFRASQHRSIQLELFIEHANSGPLVPVEGVVVFTGVGPSDSPLSLVTS